MILHKMTGALAFGLAALILAPAALAQAPNTPDPNHPGKAIYERACAVCHASPGTTRAAPFAQLIGTSPAQLRAVLTEGVMKPMAASLSPAELSSLIGYLTSGQKAVNPNWTAAMMCPAADRAVDASKPATFPGFGVDPRSTRAVSAAQSGLTKAGLAKLEVAWAIGFPQTQSLGTGAAVMGDTVYVNGAGKLLALDARTGCARWTRDILSRNTPQIAELAGRRLVLLADTKSMVHALDARTGETVWSADGKPSNGVGNIRGGVVVYRDKVIVPVSASGVGAGQRAEFECCVGHGAVTALSLKDGRRLWQYDTMAEAAYNGFVSSTGVKQRGPSGAPIWALPTVDAKRNRIIVATGENTSHPVTATSDAIISLDADTGKVAWSFQAMATDVWNMSCDRGLDVKKSGPNCPWHYDTGEGRDFDFGATPVLVEGVGGRDVVIAGQKSGHVWALDAATGETLWSKRIGEGTTLGGVHWGVTTDGKVAFVPIADSNFSEADQARNKAGVYALRLTDGATAWSHLAKSDCAGERSKLIQRCTTKFGYSAAPIVVDGQVVAATLDGKVMVLDGKTGAVVRTVDTAGPIRTANGVAGMGGSIDAHALSAGNGMVFVTSGYGSFSQTPGNVLIALKPKG